MFLRNIYYFVVLSKTPTKFNYTHTNKNLKFLISAKVNTVISNSGTFFTVTCCSFIVIRILMGPLSSGAVCGFYYLCRISSTSILCQLAIKNILTTAFAVNYDVMSGGLIGCVKS